MTKKSFALIGPGEGPTVFVTGTEVQVQVRGLQAEETAFISQKSSTAEDLVLPVSRDGVFELAPCDWVSVRYEGVSPAFIASVLFRD